MVEARDITAISLPTSMRVKAVPVLCWYWTWAALEVLRHTGIRIEEMLELTHLSLRPLRKQDGEIVPLLQVAPSKTDEERILPMSPALAKVISDIITRHQARYGAIPLLRGLDRSEREFSHPMPFLFQHHYNSGAGAVFSDTTIRNYLAHAAARAGLRDSDGSELRPTSHDFRRLYLTELVANKLPIHIAAQLAGAPQPQHHPGLRRDLPAGRLRPLRPVP